MAATNPNNQPEEELENDSEESDFERVEVIPEEEETLAVNVIEKREDTRGKLAQYFLVGFFICIIGASFAAIIVDPGEGASRIDNFRETVLTLSGVLSGPLGFIIGYYFRKSEE